MSRTNKGDKPLVICIFGPTACRKSELALNLAQKHRGEIINVDSVQVYTEVQIGANKPTSEELKLVPHHLFGFTEPPDVYTAGRYHRDFHSVLESRQGAASVFFMVGGSGFYARAALKGLYPVEASDPSRREALINEWQDFGGEQLFSELQRRDSLYAEKIGPKDQKRIVRAIEILRHSQFKSMNELEEKLKSQPKNFREFKMALFRPREDLRKKIFARSQQMLKNGLIEETEVLLKRGLKDWAPLKSVGYVETVRFLEENRKNFDELAEEISRNTARLAKRQMTWLRSEPDIHWFDISEFNLQDGWDSAVEFVNRLV